MYLVEGMQKWDDSIFFCQMFFTLDRLDTKNHLLNAKCNSKLDMLLSHFEKKKENTAWSLQNWTITKTLHLKFGV